MKNFLSIFVAILVLASGMHLSLATHLCGGTISGLKLSFNEAKAGCGMCAEDAHKTEAQIASESCCKDHLSSLVVDNNYFPSYFSIKEITISVITLFHAPLLQNLVALIATPTHTNISPHHNLLLSEVYLSDICVFRI